MRIKIDREDCILCGNCWNACPQVFEESPEDGMSQITEPYRAGGMIDQGEVPAELDSCAEEAADSCPVTIIHVE